MLKLFLLCVCNASILLGTNGNIQKVIEDYKITSSELFPKLDKKDIWKILKQNPKEADKIAIKTLSEFYAENLLYENMTEKELDLAWEQIKQIHAEEEDAEKLHPIEPLQKKQPARRGRFKPEQSLREKVLEQEQQKTTRKYFGQE